MIKVRRIRETTEWLIGELDDGFSEEDKDGEAFEGDELVVDDELSADDNGDDGSF